MKNTVVLFTYTVSLILIAYAFTKVSALKHEVKWNIPDTIYSDEPVNGNCTVVYMNTKHRPLSCKMMKIRVKPYSLNADTCNISQLTKKDWLATGCIGDFTIQCSKSNVSVDLQCIHSSAYLHKKIKVTSKPIVVSQPTNATVDRVGLPITLTCEVSGDPNHYWVGWMHKNSIIQEGDKDSHSLFTSQRSPNTTSYHLKVHYVKAPGKYTCQVYSIEGQQLDQVTHQVSVKVLEDPSESSLLGSLFSHFS